MSTATRPTPELSRTIDAPDGEVDWIGESRKLDAGRVTRIIVGRLDADEERSAEAKSAKGRKPKASARRVEIPKNLAELFPDLTHLYLWKLSWLDAIPALPAGLQCLDVRGCAELARIADLPPELDTLVLEECPKLEVDGVPGCMHLRDLSIRGCERIKPKWLVEVVSSAPALAKLDASSCPQIEVIPASMWKDGSALVDLRFDGCTTLTTIEPRWPRGLRRIGLRGATALRGVAMDLPEGVDYVDLARTPALKKLPLANPTPQGKWPRTLFIYGSGIDLPPEVLGSSDDSNVARDVRAVLEERGRPGAIGFAVFDHEVKVIVLGNGRCGKTSLARRLVEDRFDKNEPTTHPISLWTTDLPFRAIDESKDAVPHAHLNMWDFAGQDLYHNMHRRFLQTKAVYILCDTTRGPGADPEGDERERKAIAKLPRGADFEPGLGYWQEQVASLLPPSGVHAAPPTILVETKVGRPPDPGVKPIPKAIQFDAQDATGLDDLRRRLAKEVAVVLGRAGEREIGPGPMALKEEIRKRKEANEAEFERHKKAHAARVKNLGSKDPTPHFTPPHPYLSREEFDGLVGRHCPDGLYAESPELLLKIFHLSGFVYALRRPWESEPGQSDGDASTIPDIVVLDQRWVLEAVYALFDRERCWPRLHAARGRFSASDLRDWGWRELGYSDEHQAHFMQFMRSSGICFELIPADKTVSGEAIHLAPAALPRRDEVYPGLGMEFVAGNQAQPSKSVSLGRPDDAQLGKVISRDLMLRLLVRLGRRWRRMGTMWLWGGRFESFREPMWKGERTFVELDWQPHRKDSYAGTLTLALHGKESTFLDAMLGEVREVLKPVGVDVDAVPELKAVAWTARPDHRRSEPTAGSDASLERGERDAISAHAPSVDRAIGVEIAISFAGVDGQGTQAPQSLPDTSIEKWPRLLAARLRAVGFSVLEYRTEQGRPEKERPSDKTTPLMRVSSRDLIVAILSAKYLTSEWCMQELAWVYQRLPAIASGGGRNRTVLLLGAFPGARVYDTSAAGLGQQAMDLLETHWRERARAYYGELAQRVDPKPGEAYPIIRERDQRHEYHDWMTLVSTPRDFSKFCDFLRGWSGGVNLEVAPDKASIDTLTDRIARTIEDPDVLLECARRAYVDSTVMDDTDPEEAEEAERRAALLLGQGLATRAAQRLGPSTFQDAISHTLGARLLDRLRVSASAASPELRAQVLKGWNEVVGAPIGPP